MVEAGGGSPRRPARFLLTFVFAAAGGIVWGIHFGRETYLLTPWLGLLPLVLLLGSRRPGLLGWVHGIATWATAMPWIVPTLSEYGQIAKPLAWFGLILLALYLGSYHAVFGALGGRLWRRDGWAAWLGLPALWASLEVVRARVVTGFPWNLSAYSWVEIPGALALTSWIGPYGLSALVMAVAVAGGLGWARRSWRPVACGGLVAISLLAAAALWATPEPLPAGTPGLEVRVLQPNIPNLVEPDWPTLRKNYQGLLALSTEACDQGPALLVWPESASWPYNWQRDEGLRSDLEGLRDRGCPVLFNSSMQEDPGTGESRWFNSVLLLDGAEPARYDKLHLVPFGEYVPMLRVIPGLQSLTRNVGDFSHGEELRLLPWRDEEIGMSLCYEIVFPTEVAYRTAAGATLLATLTNDAWYGDTAAPWQHFRAARFRAAENHRYLLRAAITGVSGVFGPDGAILQQMGVGERGYLSATVYGRSGRTFQSRFPNAVPLSLIAAAAFAIFGVGRRPRGT